MKESLLQDIKAIAKQDFSDVQERVNSSKKDSKISIHTIEYLEDGDSVIANCHFKFDNKSPIMSTSIVYSVENDEIFADTDVSDLSDAILSSSLTPIKAAEDDEDDAFGFDEDPMMEEEIVEEDVIEGDPEAEGEEVGEYEDPEESPSIETDNNIAGHYIVECDRCHGIFISALMESDQPIEFISGICPLCEKESDQYIKWVVKPVEQDEFSNSI